MIVRAQYKSGMFVDIENVSTVERTKRGVIVSQTKGDVEDLIIIPYEAVDFIKIEGAQK